MPPPMMLIDPKATFRLGLVIALRSEPAPLRISARLSRFGMLLLVGGDDQLRLSGLSFEALDF
jgi:hypothetical protein